MIGCWWQKWWLADNLKVMTDWYLHGDKWFLMNMPKLMINLWLNADDLTDGSLLMTHWWLNGDS